MGDSSDPFIRAIGVNSWFDVLLFALIHGSIRKILNFLKNLSKALNPAAEMM